MKSKAFITAAISSLVIIAMAFTINYITSFSHPWFIYPAFAVLWWPLSVYFAGNKNFAMYSVAGSVLMSVFFVLVNLIVSPGFLWCIFPVFVMWWWPLSMLTAAKGKNRLFSIIGAVYAIVFFVLVNLMVSPSVIWFIYPAFAVLWWPLSLLLCGQKKYKLYSVVSSIYIAAFLWLVNFLTSGGHPWFIYPAFAVAWWPLSMFFAKKNPKLYSVVMSAVTIAFAFAVNYLTSGGHPWFIYPAFAVAWWPLSMFFAKKNPKLYSIVMSLLTIAFLAVVNMVTTPGRIWFDQAVFFALWWPVVMLLGKRAKTFAFAVVSAVVIIAYALLVYYIKSPGLHPWYLYIIFPAVWWPVCVGLKKHITKVWFLMTSLVCALVYYGALNLWLSPNYFWTVYLIYPALWAVMGVFFGSRRLYFGMSICAAIVTIGFFAIVNYMTSPGTIWAVYPAFAIVWWPLSLLFYRRRKKKDKHMLKEAV